MQSRLRFWVLLLLLAATPVLIKGVRAGRSKLSAALAERAVSPAEQLLSADLDPLTSLHRTLPSPRPGDWLYSQHEPGQTFAQYVQCDPIRPTGNRDTIYVLPIGQFSPGQKSLIGLSAEFLGLYLNCEVRLLDDVGEDVVPVAAQRHNPLSNTKQFLTPFLLDEVLAPRLPGDAVALIGFTATDLWPGRNWNFVFGQASLRERVGVWSIARFGDPDVGPEEFQTCLLRTLRTATHETGHMLSLQHCTAFECNMCGSGSLEESDRYPLALCPQCVKKVCWATQTDPVTRFQKLAEFCEQHGLTTEARYYEHAVNRLRR